MARTMMSRISGLLLILSGVLTVRAAYDRWWPACQLGNYDTTACFDLQDHLYDYLPPVADWEPTGASAQWQGVAMLLLAAALIFLMPTLGRGTTVRTCLQIGLVAVALSITYLGIVGITAGLRGEVPRLPFVGGALGMWALGGPIVFGAVASIDSLFDTGASRPRDHRRTTWVLMMLATPLLFLIFVEPFFVFYTSHDTAPWSEAVLGWWLIAAGAFVGFGDVFPAGWRALRGNPPAHEETPVHAGADQ